MEKITEYLIRSTVHTSEVRAWQEELWLPTYEIGTEEKNPIFLEKRVYQGSSGAVYPYPVIEKISDDKKDKLYRVLFIENEYLKIMILPELGGRVHMAYDKVKKRHFVYYNQVVKPALVGLTGPWISGGIEFNWPQHHRPSTFLPTDYSIEENPDGSKTIWCNEVERMFRTKGMQGFTLYPGKAYLEVKVQIYNRTAFPQTFLWWANPAVVVNDHYHSVFPPDVHAVFDHGKRDVSSFPIATGVYYKQDYSAGVDISKYKNIPVPTSYMAIQSKYDFVGGYEEQVKAGLLHVADHHVSPGKKQWTWGNGDFGIAWDRNLTDEDGPYIELMTGVYTDNQPDFSWLQPYEEKTWKQYFMPYSEVGYVKNATKEVLLNLEVEEGQGRLTVYMTAENKEIHLCVKHVDGRVLFDRITDISPGNPFSVAFIAKEIASEDIIAEVRNAQGQLLLSYQAEKPEIKPIPDPAKAAKDPKEIASVEQLFLTGLHLEQYRHATYNPMDYYREALRREPGEVRCNNAVGLFLMRKGQFAQAEPYFRKAIETLTERNPNPYDGEPYYNLGWSYKMQQKLEEAYDAFYKSTWNAAWKDAGYYALAQIDCMRGNYTEALRHVDNSLIRNWHNHKSRQLKASLLRKLGRKEEAIGFINESLKIDRFNMGCRFESYLLTGDKTVLSGINQLLQNRVHSYIEYSLDFSTAGLYEEAIELLNEYNIGGSSVYPMAYYATGYFYSCKGDKETALLYYQKAEKEDHSYCFPNRLEEILILQNAMALNSGRASKAAYSLGNFWYANRQYENAISCWEESALLDAAFPTVWRNLSLAYYNKRNDPQKALETLEKAFFLNTRDSRVLMELDQLYKRLGYPYGRRLEFLDKYKDQVDERDDLFIEYITLHNQLERYQEAKDLIDHRKFHPWEGGEGKITGQYVFCRVELAKRAIADKRYMEALALLEETDSYPPNLGEGKLKNAEENNIWYYKGVAYRYAGKEEEANACFEQAVIGSSEPQQAFFYNDPQPDQIFYQGLAWRALGKEDKACSCFNKLVKHGEKHLFDECRINYFAVSLPDLAIWEDDLNKRNRIHCNYVMGLGSLGLGEKEKAKDFLDAVLSLDINHQGAQIHCCPLP
ncbi:DUF5107 domain-containing protein [Parabacteroides sp. Marseille-P3160]|uniref:DUF5107 domain-containing protein n=1 Tax=Parabacteroides sp. Marseille-P3160 TaxID=1917887 RepID=UPI0009B948C1|nr:DUF5107 domain-containing protein [Parabacteroides sp. Marseille-P3160]